MALTVGEVYRAIDGFAPFSLALEWDNVGILAGSSGGGVSAILCALELHPAVIAEAKECGANLIVTHHPILFHSRKNLCEDDAEGRMLCDLVRANIALIAAHTNFDAAQPGVNDALAQCLRLTEVEALPCGLRIGTPAQGTLDAFRTHASEVLAAPVRCYGEAERQIHRVAVLGGAGGEYAEIAREAGADVYLTGEISHHRAWDVYLSGLCSLEAGHAATELPSIKLLAECLQRALHALQWDGKVYLSREEPFR